MESVRRNAWFVSGKTQLINHFLVNKSWYLVDLPGYGLEHLLYETNSKTSIFVTIILILIFIIKLSFFRFANAPDSVRMDWSVFTKGFFLNRKTLVSVLLLVDSSTPPQKIDLDCANWLGRNNVNNPSLYFLLN